MFSHWFDLNTEAARFFHGSLFLFHLSGLIPRSLEMNPDPVLAPGFIPFVPSLKGEW